MAVDYLEFWSARNALALDAIPDFYAARVEFHGREMSARALFDEKRRFAQRWPVRAYTPREDSLSVSCAGRGDFCTVRTTFDFSASNPERGRRSQGTGNLFLGITFAGGRPVIVSETSRVLRSGNNTAGTIEDADD